MESLPSSAVIELCPGVRIIRSDLHWKFSRSGGPGGQNVNKVNTKAELRLRPQAIAGLHAGALQRLLLSAAGRITNEGELLIVSDGERTQEANRAACLSRLRGLAAAALREPKVRRKTRPTRGSAERRVQNKKARSAIKKQRGAVRENW